MRRMFFLALAALALLGMVSPDAWAPAPTPTFKITGLIDQLITYSSNASNYENNFNNRDTQLYGRTRGRFAIPRVSGEIIAAEGRSSASSNRCSFRQESEKPLKSCLHRERYVETGKGRVRL